MRACCNTHSVLQIACHHLIPRLCNIRRWIKRIPHCHSSEQSCPGESGPIPRRAFMRTCKWDLTRRDNSVPKKWRRGIIWITRFQNITMLKLYLFINSRHLTTCTPPCLNSRDVISIRSNHAQGVKRFPQVYLHELVRGEDTAWTRNGITLLFTMLKRCDQAAIYKKSLKFI